MEDREIRVIDTVRQLTAQLDGLYSLRTECMRSTNMHGDDETEKQILKIEEQLRASYNLQAILIELTWNDGTHGADEAKEILKTAAPSLFELRKRTMGGADSLPPLAVRLDNPSYRYHAEMLRDSGIHFGIVLSGPGLEPKAIMGELGEVHQDIRNKVVAASSPPVSKRPDASGMVIWVNGTIYLQLDEFRMVWPEGLQVFPGIQYSRDLVKVPLFSTNDLYHSTQFAGLVGQDMRLVVFRSTQEMQHIHQMRFTREK